MKDERIERAGKAVAILGVRKVEMLEAAGLAVADGEGLEALERLYRAFHDKKVCESRFDECGESSDAEGQSMALACIARFEERMDAALSELEAMECRVLPRP